MNRRLLAMLTTALAFCITLSCSERATSDLTGLALNDSTGDASRVVSATVTLAQSSLEVGNTTQATALLAGGFAAWDVSEPALPGASFLLGA